MEGNIDKGSVLLVTGGTGSFGVTVVKRFLKDESFSEIRILSRDEKKQDELRHSLKTDRVKFYIGDVRDIESVRLAMRGVNYVFHAAALKQVPSCEFFPLEAVRTNILGTENVISVAQDCNVKRVVVLSTDKAAYPINAMGMSKGLMEKVAIARSRLSYGQGTVVCLTRYGNVMASRGSVIPLFVNQIKAGNDITVTDPRMSRFMMTLDDAVDLVLFAFQNGRAGDLFVQKAPAATLDVLVDALKILYKSDARIKVIGTRHSEKLYETLVTREEMAKAEDLGQYFRIPADNRNLNYENFESLGKENMSKFDDYHSHNTKQLEVQEMVELLLKLPEIKGEIDLFK